MIPIIQENKNINENDEYDLHLLQTIINTLKEKPEAAEILSLINGPLDYFDIGALRTKIIKLYDQKPRPPHWIYQTPNGLGALFIGPYFEVARIHQGNTQASLFSLLLLLTKYAPSNYTEDDNYLCPISLHAIQPQHRLLTIHGKQFDKQTLSRWLNQSNKNPITQHKYSQRELDYLKHRSKITDENEPEIPFPPEDTSKILAFLIISYRCLKILIESLLLAPPLLALAAITVYAVLVTCYIVGISFNFPPEVAVMPIALVFGAAMAVGAAVMAIVLGVVETAFFALEKMISSINHLFSPTKSLNIPHPTIERSVQNFFNLLKNHKTKPAEEKKPEPVEPPLTLSPSSSSNKIQQLLSSAPEPQQVVIPEKTMEEKRQVIENSNLLTSRKKRVKNDFFLTNVVEAAKQNVRKLKVG